MKALFSWTKKTRGQREGLLNPSPCCMSSSTLIMEILMDD